MARQPAPSDNALIGFATSPRPGAIRLERVYPGSPQDLWSWLTEPAKRRLWLASGNMDLRLNGPVVLTWRFDDLSPGEPIPPAYQAANGYTQRGRITKIEPERLLAFTWGEDSEVAFEIEPRPDGSALVLTHRRLADRPEMIRIATGWFTHMLLLNDAMSGRSRRRFWSTFSVAIVGHEKQLGEPPEAS